MEINCQFTSIYGKVVTSQTASFSCADINITCSPLFPGSPFSPGSPVSPRTPSSTFPAGPRSPLSPGSPGVPSLPSDPWGFLVGNYYCNRYPYGGEWFYKLENRIARNLRLFGFITRIAGFDIIYNISQLFYILNNVQKTPTCCQVLKCYNY